MSSSSAASEPSRLRARMARRESIFSDDFVAVILDTFHDRQRAYMFFSNPLGIQADGITTEGQNDDMSFDTVWQSQRPADGLRLCRARSRFRSRACGSRPAEGRAWGIALMRGIPVNNEHGVLAGHHAHASAASRRSSRDVRRARRRVARTQHPVDSVRHVHRRAVPGRRARSTARRTAASASTRRSSRTTP